MNQGSAIRPVNFSNFYQISNVSLLPDQVALFESDSIENIGFGRNCMKVIVLGICLAGSVKFRLGNRTYEEHAGCAIFIMHGQILQVLERSPDYNAFFITLTPRLVSNPEQIANNLEQQLNRIRGNVVLRLPETEWESIVASFLHIADKYRTCRNNDFHKKMFELQAFSIVYEFCGYLTNAKPRSEHLLSKREVLFRDFIRLVAKHYRGERLIAFYAERLDVNAKYLSETIEEVSGQTPKQWIDKYVIQEAKRLLLEGGGSRSIRQIAAELSFADQSLFGKYFRRITGMTPCEFRRKGTAR